MTQILDTAGSANEDITGYAAQKQSQRGVFTTSILKVSAALLGHYSMEGELLNAEKVDTTLAQLYKMRDNDLYTYGQQLVDYATPLATDIAPFGASAADITDLSTQAATYLTLIQQPKGQIEHRGATISHLERLIAQMDELLNGKLDKVMRIFQVTNPRLYDEYLLSRSIDDTGAHTQPDHSGTIEPSSIIEITNLPYEASRTFRVKNTGDAILLFGIGEARDTFAGASVTLSPGQEAQRTSSTLHHRGDYVLLRNNDPSLSGKYELWVV